MPSDHPQPPALSQQISVAAEWIVTADALLIAAGAGMGVDSGLPDFRGTEGFWRAYPPFRQLGLRFENLASASLFHSDPELAWGFYGHRLDLYRTTIPHPGFALLRSWGGRCPGGGFVFTSNVDGQFQRASFPESQVLECHGSIHHLQEVGRAHGPIWSADATRTDVDPTTFRARPPLPHRDGQLLRPNILMFGDSTWNDARCSDQYQRYQQWLDSVSSQRFVVIELGAGSAIPTVRHESDRLVRERGARLIRINPREAHCSRESIGLPITALSALRQIDQRLRKTSGG